MVETIFYGAVMAVEAIIAWIYCERLFNRKRKLWALILAYAVTYTLHFIVSLAGNTTINCICFCLFNFVLFFFGYQVKCRSAILHAGFLCFIMLMAELLVSLVINLFGYDFAEYTHNRFVLFTLGIWSKLLYLILAVFCARIFSPHKYENEEPRFLALFCVLPIVSAFLCTAIVYLFGQRLVTMKEFLKHLRTWIKIMLQFLQAMIRLVRFLFFQRMKLQVVLLQKV